MGVLEDVVVDEDVISEKGRVGFHVAKQATDDRRDCTTSHADLSGYSSSYIARGMTDDG